MSKELDRDLVGFVRRFIDATSGPVICDCGCGCEPDGDWHFAEQRCLCASLGCPCVIDAPGKPASGCVGKAKGTT